LVFGLGFLVFETYGDYITHSQSAVGKLTNFLPEAGEPNIDNGILKHRV
jgi:hypothetical protein